jgi:purine-nucleoside phosphorylase
MTSPCERLVESLRAVGVADVELALVLGSGLGVFAYRLSNARSIPFQEIDRMPQSSVPGHEGRLVVGDVRGHRVVVQQGRVHLYEGYPAETVTRSVRAYAALGCRGLVLTNAAGGLRADWEPGTLMRITDHVNRQACSPLVAGEVARGSPYDPELARDLDEAATAAGVKLERGVYVGNLGPTYETPAEVRMLRDFGGDAVGMSTVAEAIAARAGGMRVAAVSTITNYAAGIIDARLDHEEVIAVGKRVSERFCALLEEAVPRLCARLAS